jgi:hypothetical protein
MNEKAKYKRYMVFTWSEYDNVAPFQCVADSFDSVEDAKYFLESSDYVFHTIEDGTPLFCIFDRVEGVMI